MKRLIFSLLVGACSLGMSAQDMAGVFTAMPDLYIPQLESAWRKDLVDMYNSGKEARLKNTMNGFSTLKRLTPDYLLLQTSERGTVEMKLLPLVNNTHVVCMIFTVDGPVPDSRISFYTTEWKPLPAADLFTAPVGEWYLKEGVDRSSEAYKEAASRLDMDLIHYQLSEESPTLTATYTTPAYLGEEERKKVEPLIAEPKVYTWKRSHFE